MAFTKATEVAALIKRSVLPGVAISIGQAAGAAGIEIVVRGFSHPEDGMSRVWHIELIGASGQMLDIVIVGLRKAGFELAGVAPLMKGRLTQILSNVERAKMKAAARERERKAEQATMKAELSAATEQVQKAGSEQIDALRDEITGLRELIDDIGLMPQPRGPRGPAGPVGADGKDGSPVDLSEAALSDLGDVMKSTPEEGQVLTWRNQTWQPLFSPKLSGPIAPGGGGGSGGSGSFDVSERSYSIGDPITNVGPQQNLLTGITSLAFNTQSGFGVTDLGNNEALISLSSTFNPWYVAGETTLDATGEEPVEFVAGSNITIRTDDTTTPKKIIFDSTGGGAQELDDLTDVDVTTNTPQAGQQLIWSGAAWIPGGAGTGGGISEAPLDSLPYVRLNGQWIKLSHALQLLIDGSDVTTGETDAYQGVHKDGGDFGDGTSDAGLPLDVVDLDGGQIS